MLRIKVNVAFLRGTAKIDAVRRKVIIATSRGKAGEVTMAMVGEPGSTAMVFGKVNFGAFCEKVAIAPLRGRVPIAFLRGGGQYCRTLRDRHIAMLRGKDDISVVRGGEGGAAERGGVIIATPCGGVDLAAGFVAMSTIFRILPGRSIFRSALLNLPRTGSSYLSVSETLASPESWFAGP